MRSVPERRRARLGALTAAGVAALLALGATAAAGLPHHGGDHATLTAGGASASEDDPVDPYGLAGDAGEGSFAPAPAPAKDDRPVPVARPARSTVRPVLPLPTARHASCTLDMGYGIWQIDSTAARSLTMFAAVAYRRGLPVEKAARAFERSLHIVGRTPATPESALRLLTHKFKHPRPKTYALDAVLALYRPHTLVCVPPYRVMPKQDMLTNGLTLRAQTMIFGVFAAYGGRPLGGFAPGGITTGHIENSAHYEGRAIDISFSPINHPNNQRGWLLAHWLVAHADYYQIATVIYDDVIWTNWRAPEAWRKYHHPWGDTKNPTLRHLDHIHVDVVHGLPEDPPTPAPTAAPAVAAATAAPQKRS
jgi:hypothetical protein